MTYAAANPDFVLAVLALSLPDDALGLPLRDDTPRVPLASRWMRRAWRAAYVRTTAGREAPTPKAGR
jgi:hypothetical protein